MKRQTLSFQLSAAIAALMTVLIFVIVLIMSNRMQKEIRARAVYSTQILRNLEMQNIENYFSQIDMYSLSPRNDELFLKLIRTERTLSYADREYLITMVKNMYYQRDDIDSLSLYAVNQDIGWSISQKSKNIKEVSLAEITNNSLYSEFTKPVYYRAMEPDGSGNLFTYYRTIINIQSRKPLAFISFTLKPNYIEQWFEEEDLEEIVQLVDANGTVFYETSSPDTDLSSYIIVDTDEDISTWKLRTFISKEKLQSYTQETVGMALVIGFFSIAVAVSVLVFLIRVMTNPLSRLTEQLKEAGKGNFKTRLSIGGSKEIASLCDEYNSMAEKIDTLIKQNYAVKLDWKEAQLKALESQINPHFLYNTLQTISAEAIENDQEKINDMVMSLSSMMKYTIRGGETVTLRQEIEHAKDYLFLQKARFEERLTYEFVIDEQFLNFEIPRISVITLIENSIKHGMSKTADSVRIEITAQKEGRKFAITVTDDGNGMSQERLEEIEQAMNSPHANRDGCIGLCNLSDRMKLMYGDSARLKLYSTEYTGTCTVMEVEYEV